MMKIMSSCLQAFRLSNLQHEPMTKNFVKAVPLFLIGAVSLGAVAVLQPRSPSVDRHRAPTLDAVQVPPPEIVETHAMARGETLSGLLEHAGIIGQELADLLLTSQEHVNPRRLTLGTEVTVRRWTTTKAARTIEMRLNPDTTVVFARNDSGWYSQLQLTPVTWDTVYVAGQIDEGTTLYESLVVDTTVNLPVAERVQLADEL